MSDLNSFEIVKSNILQERDKKIKTIFSPQIETFVPFASNVDPSRLNMTSKQLLQAVVHKNCDRPFIIDKEYSKLTLINSPFLEIAEDDGIILYNKNNLLIFYYLNQKKLIARFLPSSKKLINNALTLKYRINKKSFKKGDLLWDYTNIDPETFIPKIGYRAKIAFMQWFGYNADDAVVVSESFAKKARINYTEKVYIPITKRRKYFRIFFDGEEDYYLPKKGKLLEENICAYENIDASEHFTSEIINFSSEPSKFYTKYIKGIKNGVITRIIVHTAKPLNIDIEDSKETIKRKIRDFVRKLDEEYIYNRGLIIELEDYLIDQYIQRRELFEKYLEIGMNIETAKEFAQQQFNQYIMMEKLPKHYKSLVQDELNVDPKSIDFLIEIDIDADEPTTRSDKFTNIFAGKAVNAMIVPDNLMPRDTDGKPLDMIFNTLGIPGRNNWGVIFEAAISLIIEDIEKTAKKANEYRINNSDETKEDYQQLISLLEEKLNFINENFIKLYDSEYYNDVKNLIKNFYDVDNNGVPFYEKFIIDVVKNGFYLFVPNFPEISYKTFYNDFIKKYSEKFNLDINKKEIEISSEFMEWLRTKWNFKFPFETIKSKKVKTMIASNYILKLYHTAISKYNAVNFTTTYSKITGQPVRGKKRSGGQHVSWQSLAALLAHKEDNAILKEFYTIKSDSTIKEKELFILNFMKNGVYYLKPKYNSETKKTLTNALKFLGMNFDDEN